jgi:hypothetical protein
MTGLIARTRVLIGDPSGASQQFSDDQIEQILDGRRMEYRYLILLPLVTLTNAATTYLAYQAPEGLTDWETDVVVSSNTFATLTPASSDYINGRFTFATDTRPPVYLTGKTYDLYGAAADLLEAWAATGAGAYDFTTGRQTFNRSQIGQNRATLARQYRGRARTVQASVRRTDIASPVEQDDFFLRQSSGGGS